MLRPPYSDDPNPLVDPERILVYGGPGVGKTTGWLSIARWSFRTQSDARFFVIDTDAAVSRMLKGYPDLVDANTLTVRRVFRFEDYEAALDEYLAKARPQDWLVVDFIGTSWDAAQEGFTRRIHGEDLNEFFLNAREAGKQGNPLDGWKDWSVINGMQRGIMNKVIHLNPGHSYLTATSDVVRETDDKVIRETFGHIGARPKGQKHLGHQVHTAIHMKALRPGETYMTTAKDREREAMNGVPLVDFVPDYLVKVAGWKL